MVTGFSNYFLFLFQLKHGVRVELLVINSWPSVTASLKPPPQHVFVVVCIGWLTVSTVRVNDVLYCGSFSKCLELCCVLVQVSLVLRPLTAGR